MESEDEDDFYALEWRWWTRRWMERGGGDAATSAEAKMDDESA